MLGATSRQRRGAFPHPADADRALRRRRVDDVPALGDLDQAARHQPPGGRAGRLHLGPPLLAADGAGRLARADRGAAGAGVEQVEHGLLERGVGPVVPRRRQASEHQRTCVPVALPLLAPGDGAPAARARLGRGHRLRTHGAVRAQRAGAGPAQPRPRVQGHDVEGGRPAPPAGHGGEGRGQRPAGELGARVAEPDLGPELGQRLGEEHQPLAGQPQPGEQRLVEDEDRAAGRGARRAAGSASPSDSAVSQTASGVPDDLRRSTGRRRSARRRARPAARPCGPDCAVRPVLHRAGAAQRAAAAQLRRPLLDLPAAEAVDLAGARADGPLPAQPVRRRRAVQQVAVHLLRAGRASPRRRGRPTATTSTSGPG